MDCASFALETLSWMTYSNVNPDPNPRPKLNPIPIQNKILTLSLTFCLWRYQCNHQANVELPP